MAEISKITLPSGSTYDIKDQAARDAIAALENYTDYLGVTTTPLTDGANTNPIVINGESVTAKKGNIVNYQASEFIFNGTVWQLFGDLSGLGTLAFQNSASGFVTATGTISQPTFSGASGSVSVSGTPLGSVSLDQYTPAGTISTPDVTIIPTTATANSITDVGTLPSFTATVASETLTLGFSQGTLPTKGADTTVLTGIDSVTASQPTFTGTAATINATFTGALSTATGSFTPSGTVSQPTFAGNSVSVTVS